VVSRWCGPARDLPAGPARGGLALAVTLRNFESRPQASHGHGQVAPVAITALVAAAAATVTAAARRRA
jgi:hypothetical protein